MVKPLALALVPALVSFAVPASADTLLDLSNSASVSVRPDELDAVLTAEAEASSVASAQSAVNRAIAAALAASRGIAGLTVETGPYSAWMSAEAKGATSSRRTWQARQSIVLRGTDGVVLLGLVGRLQEGGLALQQLGWRLSEAAKQQAEQAALRQAVAGLRHRAEVVALLLGLRFETFRSVRVGEPPPPIFPPVPLRMIGASTGGPPPSAESGPVPVSATVSAQAVLAPEAK